MSRLTIDISAEQYKALKAAAALEGKTIKQYAVERLFSQGMIEVTGELADFLQARRQSASKKQHEALYFLG